MRYKQYKFKFYLNARHAIYMDGKLGQSHPHTWEIVLNVLKGSNQFVQFHTLEEKVEQFMERYQDQYLNEVEPFDRLNPTLENCCEYFKEQLVEILNKEGWIFLMMEMSETPSRSYVISLIDEGETEEMQTINSLTDLLLEEIKSFGNEDEGNS